MKVLFIATLPAPYKNTFYNLLSSYCDVTVLYEKKISQHRNKKWIDETEKKYREIYLNEKHENKFNRDLFQYLNHNYDVIVIGGFATLHTAIAIKYLQFKKRPFFLLADGGIVPKTESFLSKTIKKFLVGSATYWLSSGENTSHYFKTYGADKSKIFTYPFTSLQQHEISKALLTKEEQQKLRQQLNLPQTNIVVAVGQFIERKGFDILIRNADHFTENTKIYLIGDQPTQEYLEMKHRYDHTDKVEFLGFKSKQELMQYYQAADVFVLPTREDIWGLVVNEAMTQGAPVVTTTQCVAGQELIENDVNGYLVDVNDEQTLINKINLLLNNPEKIQQMSENNLKKIQTYTLENMAKSFFDIFVKVKEGK